MQQLSFRTIAFLAFLGCAVILATGIYLEVAIKLVPCPLCILQRSVYIILGILFLIGCFLNINTIQQQRWFYGLVTLVALIGVVIAGRQVWLQLLPPTVMPACGANLKNLFSLLSFTKALQVIFQGTGDCIKVTWRLLGMSVAQWSLLGFVGLTGVSLWQMFRKKEA